MKNPSPSEPNIVRHDLLPSNPDSRPPPCTLPDEAIEKQVHTILPPTRLRTCGSCDEQMQRHAHSSTLISGARLRDVFPPRSLSSATVVSEASVGHTSSNTPTPSCGMADRTNPLSQPTLPSAAASLASVVELQPTTRCCANVITSSCATCLSSSSSSSSSIHWEICQLAQWACTATKRLQRSHGAGMHRNLPPPVAGPPPLSRRHFLSFPKQYPRPNTRWRRCGRY
jgi:hypothetical protein